MIRAKTKILMNMIFVIISFVNPEPSKMTVNMIQGRKRN